MHCQGRIDENCRARKRHGEWADNGIKRQFADDGHVREARVQNRETRDVCAENRRVPTVQLVHAEHGHEDGASQEEHSDGDGRVCGMSAECHTAQDFTRIIDTVAKTYSENRENCEKDGDMAEKESN